MFSDGKMHSFVYSRETAIDDRVCHGPGSSMFIRVGSGGVIKFSDVHTGRVGSGQVLKISLKFAIYTCFSTDQPLVSEYMSLQELIPSLLSCCVYGLPKDSGRRTSLQKFITDLK